MQARSFPRNTSFLLASQALGVMATLAFVPLLARYLGVQDYGRYNYVYAFVGLFEILSVFGLHQIFVREVAREHRMASRYLGNVLLLKVFLSLGAFALICLAGTVFVEADLRVFVLIVATEVLLRKFFIVNLALTRALERMEYELVVTVAERGVALAGVLAAIKFDWGLLGIFLAFLTAAVVHASVASCLVWRLLIRPDFTRIRGFRRLLLSNAWPLGLSRQAEISSGRIGPVLLDHWHGPGAVGIYAGAYRIYQILLGVVAEAISRAALPVFSRLSTNRQRFTPFLTRVMVLAGLAGISVSVLLWILAPVAIGILLGPDFESSVYVLRWIVLALPLVFLDKPMSAALQATNRQLLDGFLTIGALSANLILSAMLIPAFGPTGSAWALIGAQILTFSTKGFALVHESLPKVKPIRSVFKHL